MNSCYAYRFSDRQATLAISGPEHDDYCFFCCCTARTYATVKIAPLITMILGTVRFCFCDRYILASQSAVCAKSKLQLEQKSGTIGTYYQLKTLLNSTARRLAHLQTSLILSDLSVLVPIAGPAFFDLVGVLPTYVRSSMCQIF